jgi:hypothetical protein
LREKLRNRESQGEVRMHTRTGGIRIMRRGDLIPAGRILALTLFIHPRTISEGC